MTFQVIDWNEGDFVCERQRFAGHHSDHDPADQARSAGRSDGVEIRPRDAALSDGLGNDRVGNVCMGARGNLRHNPAIGGVFLDLRVNDFRQNFDLSVGFPAQHGSRSFIAAGFDSEKGQCVCHGGDIGRPAQR